MNKLRRGQASYSPSPAYVGALSTSSAPSGRSCRASRLLVAPGPPMYGQWNGHGPACCVTDRVVAVVTILHRAAAKFKSPRRRQEGPAGTVLYSSLRHVVVQDYINWKLVVFRGDKGYSRETAKVRRVRRRTARWHTSTSRRVITQSSVLRNRALGLLRPIASTWARTRRTSAIPRALTVWVV